MPSRLAGPCSCAPASPTPTPPSTPRPIPLAAARQRSIPLVAALLGLAAAASPCLSHAESATVLPGGSQVLYSGVGVTTYATGASTAPRDRAFRNRLSFYGAAGLTDRLQLSLDAPLMYAFSLDDPAQGPCPGTRDSYCVPVLGVGEVGLHARYALVRAPIWALVGLGARSDAWNAATRDRWTNIGQGVTSFVGSALVGDEIRSHALPFGWTAWAHYVAVIGREVTTELGTERLPPDEVKGGVEGWLQLGLLRVQASTSGYVRLGGVDFGDTWLDYYTPTDDLWGALSYRELRAEGKLSLSLPHDSGLHLAVSRVVAVVNGPSDLMDISLGVHHWFGP